MTGVTEITMSKAEARAAYLEYRHAFHYGKSLREQRALDGALMKGYKAVSTGKRVVDLHGAMHTAGVGPDGYPKLAICRAHEQRCTVRVYQSGGCVFHSGDDTRRGGKANTVTLPAGTFPEFRHIRQNEREAWPDVRAPQYLGGTWKDSAVAVVPIIPAKFRPSTRLENFHILWEAEWKKAVPVDPMLLRHLDGALYVVLASWDLTPLERAVLGGRVR